MTLSCSEQAKGEQVTNDRKPGRPRRDTRQDVKLGLLNAAVDLFSKRGFDGASLSQIAAQAGTDVGLTRYYFGSKAQLWEAAVSHLAQMFADDFNLEAFAPDNSSAEQLKAAIRAFVFTSARWPQMSRVIVFDGDKDDSRGKFIADQIVAPFFSLLSGLIVEAQAEGAIPAVSARTLFFMITHGGSFPMALPALTDAFPGEPINSDAGLNAHADAIIALVFKESS